jgi:L-histidine N-alpha-methyltransferase
MTMIHVENHLVQLNKSDVIQRIFEGLSSSPKRISSMYFYDDVGSKLFEQITSLPEYYLTRTEKSLLKEVAPSLSSLFNDCDIVEIGSGDCSKISILLNAVPLNQLASIRYVPIDVSKATIEESAEILMSRFPVLQIHGMIADFMEHLPFIPTERKRFFLFLGSTVGNLLREQAHDYFLSLGSIMRSGEMLLLGVDMVKDKAILEGAYNDSAGITRAFNRNILNVVNKRAGTNFIPGEYEHVAFYNEEKMRIEMHLRAMRDVTVSSKDFPEDIVVTSDELIHTENSHKFTRENVASLADAAGLEIERFYSDEHNLFSLVHMIKK